MTRRPWGLKWRSSTWFVTIVVGLGLLVDLLVYSSIVPVIPFRLQEVGYNDVPARTGWLLAAYSIGIVVGTLPISFLAERYWNRKYPLIIGLLALVASQVMFMEAPVYWLLCISRVLQGISSAVVWIVGFALLCDTVPEELVGQQLGLAMTGFTIGFAAGPPLGGLLFDKLGFRAPFILGMSVAIVDLVCRLLVIERSEASHWLEKETGPEPTLGPGTDNSAEASEKRQDTANDTPIQARPQSSEGRSQLSVIRVIIVLCKSRQAMAAFTSTFCYGIVLTAMEPTMPLRLQEVYGYNSLKVGLIYMAAVVPTLVASPLSGWLSDRFDGGIEWVSFLSMLLSMPWWIVMAVRGPVALFATSLALASFFLSGVLAPLTADLAAAAREVPGLGYAHVFGAFNFAYSLSSAIGPIIGGQLYQHSRHGWTVIMGLAGGLMSLASFVAFLGAGSDPLAKRLWRSCKRLGRRTDGENTTPAAV